MKRGIFINQKKAACSIYESGLMIKDILTDSYAGYVLDYLETNENLVNFSNKDYDFYLINWHPLTLNIKQPLLSKFKNKIAIVVEVEPDNYIPFTPSWFDAYMIIDPTKIRTKNFFPFPRPILRYKTRQLLNTNKLVFGSFGFYNRWFPEEKRFGEIIQNANSTGMDCLVRINLPVAEFTNTPLESIQVYGEYLKSLANSNVEVEITHNYMSREELVGWLSENNLNCFPYYRKRPGLSAVTDQAISAGRGIVVTDCNTFRHIHPYIEFFPKKSYIELLESTPKGVLKMRDIWSPENFRTVFNNMLVELGIL